LDVIDKKQQGYGANTATKEDKTVCSVACPVPISVENGRLLIFRDLVTFGDKMEEPEVRTDFLRFFPSVFISTNF